MTYFGNCYQHNILLTRVLNSHSRRKDFDMMMKNAFTLLVVLALIVKSDSFSLSRPVKGVSSRYSSISTSTSTALEAGRLTDLCQVSKEACDAVSPMLSAFYKKIRIAAGDDSTAKLKSDSTFFSIADGIVQHMFIEYLFTGNKFGDIVGEEDDTKVILLAFFCCISRSAFC